MAIRSLRRFRPLQRGFSLIEMLVAMMFIGILTAGMFRVYSSNLAGFQRVNDMIGSQRRGRWALNALQDDVSSIGYFAFIPFNQPPDYSVASGTQEPFMILPSPTPVVVTGPDPANPSALVTAPLNPNPDEIQFVGDLPLWIQATVASGSSATVLNINPVSGNPADLQAGDVVGILDNAFQQVQVAATPTGNAITINSAGVHQQGSIQAVGTGMSYALTTHQPGAPLSFFRPNMVTRYSIQARSWDPSNPAIQIPCLVRQITNYPAGGTLVNWNGIQPEVIAENIEGFNVDLSFDGGTTWLRQGSASWDAIVTKMSGLTPGGKPLNPRDPNNPLWFRNFPCLIRMQVVSRSAAPRAENANAVGTTAYVRRTQTLMVTPRNFGLPLN